MVRVSAALVTYNQQILLFLRDNKPIINNPNKWSLIGGHVEQGETFEQGLLRELEEEISVRPSNFSFIMKSPGFWKEEIYLYHVPLTAEEASRIKLGDEGQEIRFFRLEELDNLPITTNLDTFLKTQRQIFEKAINSH